ncbi:MAG: hypothetical protein HQ596_05930 [Candidatus Saganbacteria bacterium]|nr:hypothetical protein [Candidatus Saganbacteria bacterium]
MLYFILTIDGDWNQYFETGLALAERAPRMKAMRKMIGYEIKIAHQLLAGRFIHFIHTSPVARDFFLRPEFIAQWKKIEANSGNVGVHCHEDDPGRAYYYADEDKMRESISFLAYGLRKNGITPSSFRGGFMTFSPKTIAILEQNGIYLDLSCDPGRYAKDGELVVSDWRNAPDNFYRMSYADHRIRGDSSVFEIPLGIYIDRDSLFKIAKDAKKLKSKPGEVVVSVLTHSYEFSSWLKRLKIKLALLILKKYGKFINAYEALEVIHSTPE